MAGAANKGAALNADAKHTKKKSQGRASSKRTARKKHAKPRGGSAQTTSAKRKRLTSPEKRERKRRKDRERRTKKKTELNAAALPRQPAKKAAAKAPNSAAPARGSRKNALSSPSSSSSSSSSSFAAQPTLQKHLTEVSARNTPEILAMEGNVVPTDATVRAETALFNRAQKRSGFDAWLEAEMKIVLSEQAEESFSLETDARVDQLREDLPRFRRAEEDHLLQEVPPKSMRVCEMNDRCESVRLSNKLGVSPPMRLAAVKKGDFDFKVCLMCLRNMASAQLLRLRMDRTGMVREGCLQSHANFVNVHGEYRKIDCLAVRHDRWEGICLPIVQHRDSGYEPKNMPAVETEGGERVFRRRFWCQNKGYPLPETGVAAPSSPSAVPSPPGALSSSFAASTSSSGASSADSSQVTVLRPLVCGASAFKNAGV